MNISSELISQFVKTTKDTTTSKKETTLYGTVVVQNNKNYVQLDGSTVLTPVNTNVVVDNGDRVSVLIKNHTATITGNNTVKSNQIRNSENNVVRVDEVIAGYVTAGELQASNARIDTLETANVKVQNTLKAQQAVINDLDVNYANVEHLHSEYIEASELEAELASFKNVIVDEIDSEYATIEKLNASNAEINNLKSTYGDIKILIFGSAGGETIQTEFSNAVIAQLGDAQIKSAMIESIDTSKVEVKSGDDGKLLIADETIQISDENRVRVQMGKDASGDYTINVWNQNGELIFNSNGITEKAITKGLIRNDMISDTANISSSKIYLDEEKQTLDVAFKSLSDDVTSKGAAITANTEAIKTKVWQQDINDAKDELNTAYSSLNQTVDGINTVVANHTVQVDENAANISAAQTIISQLTDSLSTLVTDGNGTSLMTQTDDGWTFTTAEIQNLVNTLSENLHTLNNTVGDTTNTVNILQQAVNDLGVIVEYVKIGTYEDEPCIELGEGDSDFKLRITNTKMVFTEGSTVLAYFNNQTFNVKKVIIQEELQQGGFVWKSRSNGHLSFVWTGGNS